MLKEEFPPQPAGFESLQVLVDLGSQEILKDYVSKNLRLPHQKPRKSQKPPTTFLTNERKVENQTWSKLRVVVENAM